MRKILLGLCLILVTSLASAYDWPYLRLECVDGSYQTIGVESLSVSFSEGNLFAQNPSESLQVSLASLSKIYFLDQNLSSAVSSPISSLGSAPVEVFCLTGLYAGAFDSVREACASLPAGVYIVKSDSKCLKVCVK
ncbi:MAG: hypothetical protein ACI304_03565 [Lepagella sp.]